MKRHTSSRVSEHALAPAPGPGCTAWRILHDAAAGVWVDHFDGRWLVQTRAKRFPAPLLELAAGRAASVYWRPRDKAAATAPVLVHGEPAEDPFEVLENGARFRIDFGAGYSCGIFLDQRLNRRLVRERAAPGRRILNTFAYTGGFSVMAALGGAETTTVDLSSSFLDWAWENFRANGLDPSGHHGCRGDALRWLRTFARQGRRFDGVVLDPPTFSRSGEGTFRSDRDYAGLVELAAAVAAPGGWLLCCANTHRLGARQFAAAVSAGLRRAGRRALATEPRPMPPEFRGDDYLKTLLVDLE